MDADTGDVQGRGDGLRSQLTAEQLARESDSSLELVQQLVDVGAIHSDAEGLHRARDVMVVRLARALADGGVDIEGLRWAMQNGILPLDRLAEMWSIPSLTGRTFAEFTSSLGDRADDLPAIYAAFGLAAPLPQTETRADEEAVLMRFIDLWSLLDGGRDVYLRAARINGEGVRRMDVATLDLFDELGGSPPQRLRAGFSEDDANLPSALLGALMPTLYDWLHTRHLEHEVFERIVHFVERALVRSGGADVLDREPPAIAFVDLAGYTAMTQAIGDDAAARSLLSMQALAEAAAVAHGGRVVKLLGDGVMLRYASAGEAVASVRDLMREIAAAGLPPAHAGIAAGPIVARDGDVYGHTVNLAARIAGVASAGELMVTRELAEGLGPGSTAWQDVGVVQLKGIEGGVALVRIESPDDATAWPHPAAIRLDAPTVARLPSPVMASPIRIDIDPAATDACAVPGAPGAYSDEELAAIYRRTRTVAMVGASPNWNRPSYFVMKYLQRKGFRVIPVNPVAIGQTILGEPVVADLRDITEPVDVVDIFRKPEAVPGIVDAAIDIGAKVVWMQLGIHHEQAAATAEAAGLTVIQDRCMKIEYGRLSGELAWSGIYGDVISSRRQRILG